MICGKCQFDEVLKSHKHCPSCGAKMETEAERLQRENDELKAN
jgi:predicted nucleic acid-binding Zn ribbon protein